MAAAPTPTASQIPPSSTANTNNSNLLTIIIDATTFTWTHRALARSAKDKALLSKNKPSAGPATLDDVISAVLTLANSFCCLNRENVVVVIGATEEGVGVLYPRKGGEGNLEEVVMGGGVGSGEGGGGNASVGGGGGGVCTERVDLGLLHDYVKLGVAELVNRAVERVERRVEQSEGITSAMEATTSTSTTIPTTENGGSGSIASAAQAPKKGAAIASALSLALCTINRFMVASHAGVSALANNASLSTRYKDDEGVLALIGSGGINDVSSSSTSSKQSHARGGNNAVSPRTLILQASPDRTSDYNALMNCAFASIKSEIVIDGCFIPSGMKEDETSSPYLQQLVDQTGGVYLSVPSGAAQIGGALSEVLLSVFLPPPNIRHGMNLPKLHNVDFRARCFESGESIDVAQICNQCLSIFKERPKEVCLTCGARVRMRNNGGSRSGNSSSSSSGMKKMKLK